MNDFFGLWTWEYDPKTIKRSKSQSKTRLNACNKNEKLKKIERNNLFWSIWNEGGVNGVLRVVQQDHFQPQLMQIAIENFID